MKVKQNQTSFHGIYLNLTAHIFNQNISNYFNDFQNQDFSIFWLKWTQTIFWLKWTQTIFWLKWTQTMAMKQNQTFFHGIYSKSDTFLYQNQNFSSLWLKWTETMGMKQNQTFFHGTYSNLTLFFIGRKMLKYFNDFYNWHF